MEIEEAFTTDVIEAAGTNVTEEEETRLIAMARRAYNVNEMNSETQVLNLAVLMFVAGRTYQTDQTRIPFQMSPGLANLFMEFLGQEATRE